MRVDKYIWHTRLFKTRSVATKACKEGKVTVNDKGVKPSHELNENDTIGVRTNGVVLYYKVLGFPKNRVGAKLVADYLCDVTPNDTKEKLKTIQESQRQYRGYGTGKPSKKDRRDINKFFNS